MAFQSIDVVTLGCATRDSESLLVGASKFYSERDGIAMQHAGAHFGHARRCTLRAATSTLSMYVGTSKCPPCAHVAYDGVEFTP